MKNISVIIDAKKFSEKNTKIFNNRTGSFLKSIDVNLLKKKLSFFFVNNHNSRNTLILLKKLNINCGYNAGTPRKISKLILKQLKYGMINVHPAKLPEYRGCSSTEWTIYNHDRLANTVHFMCSEYDQGPIIKIKFYKFKKKENYKFIRSYLYKDSLKLGVSTLLKIQKKNIDISNFLKQNPKEGKYWNVIPKSKFALIPKILKKGYSAL